MRKPITAISMIPVNGVYHPTEPLTCAQKAMVRRYADNVSDDVISPVDKAEYIRKALEKAGKALSEHMGGMNNE